MGPDPSNVSFFNQQLIRNLEIVVNITQSSVVNHPYQESLLDVLDDREGAGNGESISRAPLFDVSVEIFTNGEPLRKYSIDELPEDLVSIMLRQELYRDVLGFSYFGKEWSHFGNMVYLPAARTGIMLALKYFIDGALRQSVLYTRDRVADIVLPAPLSDFAARMTYSIGSRRRGGENILNSILKGKLTGGGRRGAYEYTPEGMQQAIPLASTSSLVTELSAFSLLLQKIRKSSLLIFEEPEAHLHLEAQREMAKILARLVNEGARIIITTHSDTFMQQINNLIALHDHPGGDDFRKELGVSLEETLSRGSVAAYDFRCEDGITQVAELKITRTGFVADSLNDVLVKLANETMMINEGLES